MDACAAAAPCAVGVGVGRKDKLPLNQFTVSPITSANSIERNDQVLCLFLSDGMDPIPQALIYILDLLRKASDRLKFARKARHQIGIDALVNEIVLLERGFANEASEAV